MMRRRLSLIVRTEQEVVSGDEGREQANQTPKFRQNYRSVGARSRGHAVGGLSALTVCRRSSVSCKGAFLAAPVSSPPVAALPVRTSVVY